MKKLKLTLLFGAMFSTSLYASSVDLNDYHSSTVQQQKESYTKFTVKLKEGATLEQLSQYVSKDISVLNEMFLGYVSVISKGQLTEEFIRSSNLVEEVDINSQNKIILEEAIDHGYSSEVSSQALSNDPFLAEQKYFNETSEYQGASSLARAIEEKQQSNIADIIYIGVVDSGALDHEDIIFQDGQNFVSYGSGDNAENENRKDSYYDISNANVSDETDFTTCTIGHGLKVASVIGSLRDNNVGIAGIVTTKLIAARAVGQDCKGNNIGDANTIANSIYWLAGGSVANVTDIVKPVDVINVSLSIDEKCSTALQTAINYAVNNGIIVVSAAGNSSGGAGGVDTSGISPASCNNVITVANNNNIANKSRDSNYGEEVTLSALGEDVKVAYYNGVYPSGSSSYITETGTSFSAPVVSGVVGLLKEKYPDKMDYATVNYLLTEGVTEHNESFSSIAEDCLTGDRCGAGVLNGYNTMSIADQMFGFSSELSGFYEDKNSCEGTVYLEKMSNLGVDVCNVYNVQVNEIEQFKDVKYQVIKRNSSANSWTPTNTVVVSDFIVNDIVGNSYKLKEKEDGFDYGIRICEATEDDTGKCFNSQDLDFSSIVKPDFCK